MSSKKKSTTNFFKNNAYYLVLALVVFAVVAVSVALFVRQNASDPTLNSSQGGNVVEKPKDSSTALPDSSTGGGNQNQEEKPEEPPKTTVSFILPVKDYTLICDYTEASLVYNKTLNIYTGHCAVDFGGEAGSEVVAVYGGTVESITTSYLTGTTVVIDHGNNLKTVYNGLEVSDALTQGMTVSQGFTIGYVSDNNKQEYKDGPHLHFEVLQDGQKISPYTYLVLDEK